MQKITMDKIAHELGTSKNTVSRALRGLPGVSEDMRQKIKALAGDFGYKSKKGKDNSLAHIFLVYRKGLLDDLFFWPAVISGIWDYGAENNIGMWTFAIDESKDGDSISIPVLEQKCDGILVVNSMKDSVMKRLLSYQVPLVVVDHYSESIECDYVNIANKTGIGKAMAYLVENNHRRIGFINNINRAFSYKERYEAYVYYMNEYGLPIDERFVWHDPDYKDYQYYQERMELLRQCAERPTAWICVNDCVASDFTRVLEDNGFHVPDDVSIIGFDNTTNLYDPIFTTLEVPRKSLGHRAFEELMIRIRNPDKPFGYVSINTNLIIRNSVKKI